MPGQKPWWQGQRGEWYVVVQVCLLGLVAVSPWITTWLPAWPATLVGVARWIGALMLVVATVIALAGALHLGHNLTPLPHPKDDATLVETGIYGLIRHPLYSGLIGLSIGWALFMANTLTLLCAALLFVFFDIKTRREERWLMTKFPAYADYRRRVRKFMPGVY